MKIQSIATRAIASANVGLVGARPDVEQIESGQKKFAEVLAAYSNAQNDAGQVLIMRAEYER